MARNTKNSTLHKAKESKSDEFYTLYSDIEREIVHYSTQFSGKIVYCNCDDPLKSNFFKFFVDNFNNLGLKKLISACYQKYNDSIFENKQPKGRYIVYKGETIESIDDITKNIEYFQGDGDFRSAESKRFLKECDIVVTNPPFSLFRDFVNEIIRYDKKFLIIGNINAITYKEIFALIQDNKIWLGHNLGRGISGFIVPDYYELYGTETRIDEEGHRIVSTNNCLWLTNLDSPLRNEFIPLTKEYKGNEAQYPIFDNYDAINVNRTQDIPMDFSGVMGVPITFLHKYNPKQFKIIKFRKGNDGKDLTVGGRCPYFRILIKNVTIPEQHTEAVSTLLKNRYNEQNRPCRRKSPDAIQLSLF